MKIRIKPNQDKMYFGTLESVVSFMTKMISRKGYSIKTMTYNKKTTYKVDNIEEIDQDIIKNLVIAECEQIGLEYEIID